MAKKVRVGIIGTGFGLSVQVPGFQAHPETEVVAIASVRPGRAAEAARKAGIPQAFDDWKEMLQKVELDLVSVVSAPHLHHPMTMAALELNRHVLCEKPMALNIAQAREMQAAAEERGVVNAIDHEFRYQPARVTFKRLVDEGLLGELLHVSFTWSRGGGYEAFASRPMGWLWQEETGGGMLGALGSHVIDSLHWWFGPIAEVCGLLETHVRERRTADGAAAKVTADDAFSFLFRLARGGSGVVRFIAATHHGIGVRVEAFGREGTLVLEDDKRVLAGRRGEELREVPLDPVRVEGAELPPDFNPAYHSFLIMADHLAAAILRGERRDYATFAHGVRVQGVLDAVRASAKSGAWEKTNPKGGVALQLGGPGGGTGGGLKVGGA